MPLLSAAQSRTGLTGLVVLFSVVAIAATALDSQGMLVPVVPSLPRCPKLNPRRLRSLQRIKRLPCTDYDRRRCRHRRACIAEDPGVARTSMAEPVGPADVRRQCDVVVGVDL